MRVNMVPRDGGNQFRGQIFGNYAGECVGVRQLRLGRVRQRRSALRPLEPDGQHDVQPEQHADQRQTTSRRSGTSTRRSAARIKRDKLWFHYTFRHWGVEKTKADSYADLEPLAVRLRTRHEQPGIDDGHIVSNAVRVSWAVSGKDKISVYHDNQRKYRDHWGIAATHSARGGGNPGDADQLRQRHEVDAHAHQPLAARSWLRHLQPGVHRALSAERHWPRGQGVGPRGDSQFDASTT